MGREGGGKLKASENSCETWTRHKAGNGGGGRWGAGGGGGVVEKQ